MKKLCFLFGNRNAPEHISLKILDAARYCYLQQGVRIFIVGHYGNFDRLAGSAIKQLKIELPDITLLMLIPYHPSERPVDLLPGWDGTFYPEGMERVPRQYAIVRANEYMARNCDCAICYAPLPGNARNLRNKITRQQVLLIDLSD